MADRTLVAHMLASDIPPLSLCLSPIRARHSGAPVAYRTAVHIHDGDEGVLYPAQYRAAAARCGLAPRLSLWALTRAAELLPHLHREGDDTCALYVELCPSLLYGNELTTTLHELLRRPGVTASRLCVVLPPSVLHDDPRALRRSMGRLQAQGIQTALDAFGDADCPMMRLCGLPFDTVLLHRALGEAWATGDEVPLRAAVSFLHAQGCGVIADLPVSRGERLPDAACPADAYTDSEEAAQPPEVMRCP